MHGFVLDRVIDSLNRLIRKCFHSSSKLKIELCSSHCPFSSTHVGKQLPLYKYKAGSALNTKMARPKSGTWITFQRIKHGFKDGRFVKNAMGFKASELKTLSTVCDTFVPSIKGRAIASDFYARSASQIDVDKILVEIIETKLPPSLRIQMHRLLRILDSPLYNLILSGRPVKFSQLDDEERVRYLKGWRDSRIGTKRTAFQALKRFSCFLSYSVTDDHGTNPNWRDIGYAAGETERTSHPSSLTIRPLIPEHEARISCDVCIVGSGAGGSVVAHELSKSGVNVVVVEGGGYSTSETFEHEEFSMKSLTPTVFDYSSGLTKDLSFIMLSGRGVGGGTIVNWSTSLKPPDHVLKEWENEYGIQGVTSREFQTDLDEVWSDLGVGTSESQRNSNNNVLWEGCKALGYREGEDYEVIARNAVGCNQRCDFCTFGCVYSCKQSTIMNYLPMAFSSGARFLFNTRVNDIVLGDGKARGVRCSAWVEGKERSVIVDAKVVVLACGAINTPALLLRSGIKGKNIGRNLRLHPTTALAAILDREVTAWKGPPQTVAVRKFSDLDGTKHGFWIEAAPPYAGLFALSVPWSSGKQHKDFMREKFSRTTAPIILLREWGGGTVQTDKHGSPVVAYAMDSRDKKNMIRGLQETARIVVAAGVSEIMSLHADGANAKSKNGAITTSQLDDFCDEIEREGIVYNKTALYSAHLMGSCRMGANESLGAVKPTGELYSVENLYLGDASVFPTAPGVNPMITIMAMAKRTSRFIRHKLGSG